MMGQQQQKLAIKPTLLTRLWMILSLKADYADAGAGDVWLPTSHGIQSSQDFSE